MDQERQDYGDAPSDGEAVPLKSLALLGLLLAALVALGFVGQIDAWLRSLRR
jgi:hypothetical protein